MKNKPLKRFYFLEYFFFLLINNTKAPEHQIKLILTLVLILVKAKKSEVRAIFWTNTNYFTYKKQLSKYVQNTNYITFNIQCTNWIEFCRGTKDTKNELHFELRIKKIENLLNTKWYEKSLLNIQFGCSLWHQFISFIYLTLNYNFYSSLCMIFYLL